MNSDPLPTQRATFTPLPAPPTRPGGSIDAPRRSVWPLIFGIGSLVMAGGGVLSSLIGLAMPLFEKAMYRPPGAAITHLFGPPSIGLASYYICSMVLSGVLAVAGLRLIKRKPSAATWAITWAILKFFHAFFAVYFTIEIQKHSLLGQQSIYYSPNTKPNPQVMAAISQATIWFTGVITAIWCISFPVLFLCWFSRPKIRNEVKSWSTPPAAPTPPPQA